MNLVFAVVLYKMSGKLIDKCCALNAHPINTPLKCISDFQMDSYIKMMCGERQRNSITLIMSLITKYLNSIRIQ